MSLHQKATESKYVQALLFLLLLLFYFMNDVGYRTSNGNWRNEYEWLGKKGGHDLHDSTIPAVTWWDEGNASISMGEIRTRDLQSTKCEFDRYIIENNSYVAFLIGIAQRTYSWCNCREQLSIRPVHAEIFQWPLNSKLQNADGSCVLRSSHAVPVDGSISCSGIICL
jgi:hypothetical protein